MNSDELSRKLAMHFEPAPRNLLAGNVSPEGYWRWRPNYANGLKGEWIPRPHTDPEITLRLLKFLLERGKTITMTKAPNGEVYFVGTGEPSECHTSLKLAVAQAAVREIEGK